MEGARAAAERAAEKGKRAALFAAFCAVAAIFFVTGIIVLVIELGLQADRGEFLRFSGLVGSSLAFFVLAVALVVAGLFATREAKEQSVAYVPPAPVITPEEELRRMGSLVLSRFLSRMKERQTPRPPQS